MRASAESLLIAACVIASGCAAQSSSTAGSAALRAQDDRIVRISPHFDEPVLPWSGLSCPAAPAHFFGTASSSEKPDTATLAVQVEPYRGRHSGIDAPPRGPLAGAMIFVNPHTASMDLTKTFPENSSHRALADSIGLAEFRLEPGLYWVQAAQIGHRHGGALLQLPAGTRTLVRVELDIQVLC
jgi:hypothetical protein